jgi:AsmA protein
VTRRWRVVAGATVLAVLAAVLLAVALAPALIKAGLAATVLAKTGRKLDIEGTPTLGLWPRLTIGLGRTSLSERNAGEDFARIDSAHLSLAPLPLLGGRIVVDAVEVSGLEAVVVRRADGSLNIDDLLVSHGGGPLQIDIAAVKLEDAHLTWRDEKQGTATVLSGINLAAGPIRADTGNNSYGMGAASLALRLADASAALDLAGVEAVGGRLKVSRLGLNLDGKFGDAAVKGRLESPLEADFKAGTAQLPGITGKLALTHPRLPMKSMELPVTASASLDLAKPAAALTLATEFDGSKLSGRLAVERFSPLAVEVDLDMDRLDLDRYQAPGQGKAGAPDFSPPPGLDLRGSVKVGSLRMGGMQATNVRLQIGDQADSRKSAR